MAISKTLTPTNVAIQIPEFTDQPDQRVNSNCLDKEADAINALNSKIAKKANVQKDSIAGNSSVTITITTPCLVIVGRGSASNQTTTAFIDGWSAPVYINNNATFTLSVSGSSLTITNASGGYASYIVIS